MNEEIENKIREEILQIFAKGGTKMYWTIEEILSLVKKYYKKGD